MDGLQLEKLKDQIRQELLKEQEFLKREADEMAELEAMYSHFQHEDAQDRLYDFGTRLLNKLMRFMDARAIDDQEYEYIKRAFGRSDS
jgi:hypothetical protein